MRFLLMFSGLCICVMSCKDEYNICDTPRNVQLNAGFYKLIGGAPTQASPPSLTVNLINSSVLLYNQESGLQQFALKLNPQTDTARYFIQLGPAYPADTLSFLYSSLRVNLPQPCGHIFTNSLIQVNSTYNTIDSVSITNPEVGTADVQNLRIFY